VNEGRQNERRELNARIVFFDEAESVTFINSTPVA